MTDLADIAVGLGLPVFACDSSKRPCVRGGFKAATLDASEIRRQFRSSGAKLIGMPTGSPSGVVVIDVDIKHGQPGMDWLKENADALPPTRTHKTRSGGLHLLFRIPEEPLRNSAGRVAPGVDVRAEGGYIIVPPSPGYQVADDTAPAEMPRWLIRACGGYDDPPKPPQRDPSDATFGPGTFVGGTPYGLAALEAECRAVRHAVPGTQEPTLNAAALKLGALIAGRQLEEAVARDALIAAGNAMRSGDDRPWTADEIEKKVSRGLDHGGKNPRAPESRPDIPPPPEIHPDEIEFAPVTDEDIKQEWGEYVSSLPPEKRIPKQDPGKCLPYTLFEDIEPNLEIADFVEGVLIEGAMSVVYGESNAGKTFWVSDLAFHVAAGRPWNGRDVEQGAVIYLALEGRHGIFNRIAAWKRHYGLEDARLPLAVVTVALNLLDPSADASAVIATVKAVADQMEIPVKMIVVDTLARAIAGGNENASEDMGALVQTGDMIRQETGSHLMWIHHSGKEQAKGARGHSSLRGATDTEIEVVADGDSRSAEVRKQRDMPKGDVFRFELSVVELGTNRRGKPVTSCVVTEIDDQAAGAATDRRRSLKGHSKRAFDVLTDLCASSGVAGSGLPSHVTSVPEKWWRERFYEGAMAGAEQEAKKKAFRRAADELVERRYVGLMKGRVWVVHPDTNATGEYVSNA